MNAGKPSGGLFKRLPQQGAAGATPPMPERVDRGARGTPIPSRRDKVTALSLTGQNSAANKIVTGMVATPTIHRCAEGSRPKEARMSNPRTENE